MTTPTLDAGADWIHFDVTLPERFAEVGADRIGFQPDASLHAALARRPQFEMAA